MSVPEQAAAALVDGWQIQGRLQALGQGLINDTLLVTAGAPGPAARQPGSWVLQRINARVFPDPGLVMHNVGRVVRHLQARAPELVPGLVSTPDGRDYFRDAAGGYWRLWDYVANAQTLQSLADDNQARSAGTIFARLQNALRDLSGPRLRAPIPGFMSMPQYLKNLDAELPDLLKLEPAAREAVAFIDARRPLAAEFQQRSSYVHGDCKINNLLFRGDLACRVLDLDTVMYGHWAWDFGDLVRSGADAGGQFSLALYRGLVQGFVAALGQRLAASELVLAPRYVGLMLGIRFLTDHLAGDRYFRVHQHGDNLARASAQLDLVRQMEIMEPQMLDIARDSV